MKCHKFDLCKALKVIAVRVCHYADIYCETRTPDFKVTSKRPLVLLILMDACWKSLLTWVNLGLICLLGLRNECRTWVIIHHNATSYLNAMYKLLMSLHYKFRGWTNSDSWYTYSTMGVSFWYSSGGFRGYNFLMTWAKSQVIEPHLGLVRMIPALTVSERSPPWPCQNDPHLDHVRMIPTLALSEWSPPWPCRSKPRLGRVRVSPALAASEWSPP